MSPTVPLAGHLPAQWHCAAGLAVHQARSFPVQRETVAIDPLSLRSENMTNRTPPPLAALHEPWGWVKRLLVLVFVAVGCVVLEVKDRLLG
ncbi:hypothetical protein NBRGN_110_03420 [Nocardia brasiliensis NBRC 14402]|nr:hypothetical protein NBRGN_110_03420 [Nocardia brasiliensis NBRC 14402]